MTIYVVRHGRTTANASGLLLGRADPELDPTGINQAKQIAAVLPEELEVITSPLTRARQTAAALGPEYRTDERLLELDYGEYDLTPTRDIPAEVWAAWRRDPHFRPPGGETLTELSDRVIDFFEELAAAYAGGHVAVVTHVSPIKAAVAWALGTSHEVSWRTMVSQASISRIEVGERGPTLHGFNDINHLA